MASKCPRSKRAEAGVSLVEMMIVVAVIAILAGLFVQNAQSAVEEARAMTCEKNRTLLEDMEMKFLHDRKRHSHALQELVDEDYVTKASCPRGGVLAWTITDESLNYDRQALVCSIHGPKIRIRNWKEPVATAAAEEDGAEFAADFSGSAAGGWTESRGGYWETSGGRYWAGRPGNRRGGEHRSFAGDESWTDYDVDVGVRLESGNGFGIFFRTSDSRRPDGYVLQYNGKNKRGTYSFRTIDNGRMGGVVASSAAPATKAVRGQDQNIRISVSGNTFTAYVNGEQVLSASNSRYASGGVGLRTWGRNQASFDDVRVETR